MQAPSVLLLCHHGTEGARLGETLAYDVARRGFTTVVHCLVVPELWAGMQGDDWLNNASTRDSFAHYVEQLLENDAKRELAAVETRCTARGLAYRSIVSFGDPAECAVAAATEQKAGLVVIGPPRPKAVLGLRSRMDLERLVRDLPCPLLIAGRR